MGIINLPCYNIIVELDENGGGDIISSYLKEQCPYCSFTDCYFDCDQSQHDDSLEDEDGANGRRDYNSAIDGIEAMILGHAVAGIDITDPKYLEGIESAVQGCANNI